MWLGHIFFQQLLGAYKEPYNYGDSICVVNVKRELYNYLSTDLYQ